MKLQRNTKKISNSETTESNVKTYISNNPSKNRVLFIVFIILFVGVIALAAILIGKNNQIEKERPEAQNTNIPVVNDTKIQSPSKETLEFAKSNIAVSGVIASYDGKNISVTTKNKQVVTVAINDDTKYRKGKDYMEGNKSEVLRGQSVQLTYDPNNKVAKVIWYGL